jgi:hypothetical protein
MELQHINVKIPVEGDLKVDPARFIEVFHRWVAEHVMSELLIDVADYRHVPAGPGVLVIGLEADYAMDNTDNVWGLRYNRKSPLEGTNASRFAQALRSAAKAAASLESEFGSEGPLEFSRKTFDVFINDRALAPNTGETWAKFQPEFSAFLQEFLGHGEFQLKHNGDPRQRFGVTVELSKPLDFAAIA